jgi:iron complex outermembrane recepter protein
MRMSILYCLLLFFLSGSLFGQNRFSISGTVTDEKNKPLPGATVMANPGDAGRVTDNNGQFYFGELAAGNYQIEVSHLGYLQYSETIYLQADHTLEVRLRPRLQTLQEVVVPDNYAEQRNREEPLNIEIVNDKFLKKHLRGSLMQTLERLPGVSTIEIGSGHSKPVIRGLGLTVWWWLRTE